jgi:RND family efflux transporter MFP subunit
MNLKRLTIILSLPVMLFACGKKEEKVHEAQKVPVVQISVARIEKGDLPQFSESVGTVKASREATVASKIMGFVALLSFKEGDRIKEGAVLVEIDDREINAQLEQAQAAVTEATASYRNAEINLKRMKGLMEQKSVTQQQVDNAVMQFDVAKARIEQANANVGALKVMLGYARVSAPFDGVITEKAIEKGEMATPGRPLFKLTDDRRLRLEAEIRESEIRGIKSGAAIDVRVDAVGKVIKGKVSQIVPSGDPATHSFLVKIDLPGTEGLMPGMFGRAYIPKGMTVALMVPKGALIEKGQLTGVFVVKEKRAGYRMIKTGVVTGDKVEVLSGLMEGEEVAVSNIEKLSDGSPVEVVK